MFMFEAASRCCTCLCVPWGCSGFCGAKSIQIRPVCVYEGRVHASPQAKIERRDAAFDRRRRHAAHTGIPGAGRGAFFAALGCCFPCRRADGALDADSGLHLHPAAERGPGIRRAAERREAQRGAAVKRRFNERRERPEAGTQMVVVGRFGRGPAIACRDGVVAFGESAQSAKRKAMLELG